MHGMCACGTGKSFALAKSFRIHSLHALSVVLVAFFDLILRNHVPSLGGSAGSVVPIAVDSTLHSIIALSTWRASSVAAADSLARRRDASRHRPPPDSAESSTPSERAGARPAGDRDGGAGSLESAVAYLLGAAVDVDHFLAAGSASLRAATNLPTRRGLVFHNPLVVLGVALCLGSPPFRRPRWACLFAASALSHLLRDATRTGLLLYPAGRTAPLPYAAFVGGTLVLPRICGACLNRCSGTRRGEFQGVVVGDDLSCVRVV